MGRKRRANWFAKCVGKKRRAGKTFKESVRLCKRKRR